MVESLMNAQKTMTTGSQSLAMLFDGILPRPIPPEWREHFVSGVFDDSRRVAPGGVFVAIRGGLADGRKFVGDALARGASVLIGDGLSPVDKVLVINVPDPRETLALLAVRWYGLESLCQNDLQLLAITGTNGKTTSGFMTQAVLRSAGIKCGLIGTIRYDLCGEMIPATMTTPGPLELARCLRQCADNGARAVVMEASSHALDQRRTDGLRFAAAAFTNLTQDHLDYHKTFDAYRDAKVRLFRELDADAKVILNVDDPYAYAMLAGREDGVITYGLENEADLTAAIVSETFSETRCRLNMFGEQFDLTNRLVGRHNVYNALTAAGLAVAVGATHADVAKGLSELRHVPGRLQRVPGSDEIGVFVDYAHTPDAVRKAAGLLKPLTRKRLIVVFGCGGDRDREKRPLMAQAAGEFADAVIVTSDNPRTEQPQDIIDDIMAGFDEDARRRVLIEPDRRNAIHAAVAGAAPGDVVLLAGKGHEDYQIIGTERLHFDDMETAIEALSLKAGNGD